MCSRTSVERLQKPQKLSDTKLTGDYSWFFALFMCDHWKLNCFFSLLPAPDLEKSEKEKMEQHGAVYQQVGKFVCRVCKESGLTNP